MDDEHIKDPAQVRAELAAAESIEEWFVGEVADYLLDDVADEEERREQMASILERLDDERERFGAGQLEASDVVEFSVTVLHETGGQTRGVFRELPSPVLLMDMGAQFCEVGDTVVIRHLYASSNGCEFVAQWPYGMAFAVGATTPMAQRLADDEDLDEDYISVDLPDLAPAFAAIGRVALTVLAGAIGGLLVRRRR